MSISVRTTGDKVITSAPYNPEFAPLAKAAGGRWDSNAKTWSFDIRDEARVREIMIRVYGTDGSAAIPMVTLRVALNECGDGDDGKLYVGGRLVAARYSRDEPVKLGTDVVLVSGSFARSGGSTKYGSVSV